MAWSISNVMMKAYDNSHLSREQAGVSWAEICSVGAPSAPLNITPTPDQYYWPDKTTEHSRLSRFGMTCEPLMADHGADVLTWFLAGFHAKPIAPQLQGKIMQMISGRKCGGSWQMSLPGTYLPKTSQSAQLNMQRKAYDLWVTKPRQLPLARRTWVLTTFGNGIGYLHTPTCTANYSAPSMQKWQCARSFVQVFGKPHPANAAWLMGWPAQWSNLGSLGMGKFQSWQQQHSIY